MVSIDILGLMFIHYCQILFQCTVKSLPFYILWVGCRDLVRYGFHIFQIHIRRHTDMVQCISLSISGKGSAVFITVPSNGSPMLYCLILLLQLVVDHGGLQHISKGTYIYSSNSILLYHSKDYASRNPAIFITIPSKGSPTLYCLILLLLLVVYPFLQLISQLKLHSSISARITPIEYLRNCTTCYVQMATSCFIIHFILYYQQFYWAHKF